MYKFILTVVLSILKIYCFAQFAPPAGQIGTIAIHKDSSIFKAWATECIISRGYLDISDPNLGYANFGDSSMAIGFPGNGIVSLGDAGFAIVKFENPIKNGPGWDFAIFENSFSDTFLELAFIEVSSDGINFYRFPATSNTQDSVQISSFGSIDATQINNLAGKYRADYGTPFDLQELTNINELNLDSITHVKIIDVVGSIQDNFASFDQFGHKINDPWNTPFASSGLDLDAVGVIHPAITSINKVSISNFKLYPNPIQNQGFIELVLDDISEISLEIFDLNGKVINKIEYDLINGYNKLVFSVDPEEK